MPARRRPITGSSSVPGTGFFSVGPNEVRARPSSYVTRHAHRTFVEDWETALRLPFQERLVVLLSSVQPKGVLHRLLVERALPPPPLNHTRADRHQPSHFEGVDIATLRQAWERRCQDPHGRTPAPAELEALLERVSTQMDSFEDSSALAPFECPDGSHLDSRSAPGFTRLPEQELLRHAPGALSAHAP